MRDFGGGTLILTRSADDNRELAGALRGSGIRVIEFPCIETRALADPGALGVCLRALGPDDWLVVTSRAGARAVAHAISAPPLRAPLAVVGPGTERVARALGMHVAFRPSRANGTALGTELPLPRGIVALARSDRADRELVTLLRDRGARVRELVAYHTAPLLHARAPEVIRVACARGAVVLLASPSALDGFISALGTELAIRCRFVALGPTTAKRIERITGRVPVVAAGSGLNAIVAAISQAQRDGVPT
jgi:uroporphyrinogen-III synthase